MKALHHVTSPSGTIWYDLKPAIVDIHEAYVQLNCTTIDIKTLKQLIAAHGQHFPAEKVINYQSGEQQDVGVKY